MANEGSSGGAALPAGLSQCEDFMQFESALRESRGIDDKIIQALNNSIPTASFRGQVDATARCKELWQTISTTYAGRERAINRCVSLSEAKVAKLREGGDRSAARQAQVTLRMLQNESSIEEVIRNRTHTAFNEKCRDHYKPPTS